MDTMLIKTTDDVDRKRPCKSPACSDSGEVAETDKGSQMKTDVVEGVVVEPDGEAEGVTGHKDLESSRALGKGAPTNLFQPVTASYASGLSPRHACVIQHDGCQYTIVADRAVTPPGDLKLSKSSADQNCFGLSKSFTIRRRSLSPIPPAHSISTSPLTSSPYPHQNSGSLADSSSLISNFLSPSKSAAPVPSDLPGTGESTLLLRRIPTSPDGHLNQIEAVRLCSTRMKHLLTQINSVDVTKPTLVKNFEYLIRLLDAAALDSASSTGCEEDDCLSKVEADAVPPEVRDWLSMTFTRNAFSAVKRRDNEKVKFRSLVNVVRVGISLDRMSRRTCNSLGPQIPSDVLAALKNLDEWSFDVFNLNDVSGGHALRYMANALLLKYDLINKFKIDLHTLSRFLTKLEEGYSINHNPYHNVMHAADVAQTVHHFISQTRLTSWMTDLEILSIVIAALIHDFEHTGTTNQFHINTRSEMAMLYNDKAVLENHHLHSAFQVLCKPENNILSSLKPAEYKEFRQLVISIVFATDMNEHGQQHKFLKHRLSKAPRQNIDRTVAFSWLVHCADISHPAKEWQLHERWTNLLIDEFFRQGDEEKRLGLPVSPICDRKKTLVADTQIGFLANIVIPSLDLLVAMIQRIMVFFEWQQKEEDLQQLKLDETQDSAVSADTASTSAAVGANTTVNSVGVVSPSGSVLLLRKNTTISPIAEDANYVITKSWVACIQENSKSWMHRKETGWKCPIQECENGQHIAKENKKDLKVSPSGASVLREEVDQRITPRRDQPRYPSSSSRTPSLPSSSPHRHRHESPPPAKPTQTRHDSTSSNATNTSEKGSCARCRVDDTSVTSPMKQQQQPGVSRTGGHFTLYHGNSCSSTAGSNVLSQTSPHRAAAAAASGTTAVVAHPATSRATVAAAFNPAMNCGSGASVPSRITHGSTWTAGKSTSAVSVPPSEPLLSSTASSMLRSSGLPPSTVQPVSAAAVVTNSRETKV